MTLDKKGYIACPFDHFLGIYLSQDYGRGQEVNFFLVSFAQLLAKVGGLNYNLIPGGV